MTVVFADSFTNSSGSDVNIDEWPSAGDPDYAYNVGSGDNIIVSNANDRVESALGGAFPNFKTVRLIDAAVPTGDQEITFTGRYTGPFTETMAFARCTTTNTRDGYELTLEDGVVYLIRVDGTTNTILASGGSGIPDGSYTYRLRATGTNPVVLDASVGAIHLTYEDSSADRKESGPPGFSFVLAGGWIDDLSVDDTAISFVPPNRLSNMRPNNLGGF